MKRSTNIPVTGPPNRLHFEGTVSDIEVLGGISLHHLQQLRVTLKITAEYRTMRLSVDLYHDEQVDKLIRKAAERLDVKTQGLATDLDQLTDALETYRFQQLEEPDQTHTPTPLSDQELEAALQYLEAPDLIARTRASLKASGIVGEETNSLLMYLIFTTRKQAKPLHIISLGQSGMGKTFLQHKVSQLMPPEDVLQITSISENAFYYFQPDELVHKLVLIEDLDGAEAALYPLRELQSKGQITKTVVQKDVHGNLRTVHHTVQGNMSVAACTTKSRIYEDNADRCFLIQPDESPEQDARILRYQQAKSAGTIAYATEQQAVRELQHCQRLLEPIRVVNPYAPLLTLPAPVLKPRRTNQHYLQFIEAVTFYHQKQRPIQTKDQQGNTVEPYIETTPEDIRIAHSLLKDVLLAKSDELSGACRRFLESLKAYLKDNQTDHFTSKKIRTFLRINPNTLRRHMAELLRYGYLDKIGGDQRHGFTYALHDAEEYAALQRSVFDHLQQQVDALSCLQVVHLSPEQPNALTINDQTQAV